MTGRHVLGVMPVERGSLLFTVVDVAVVLPECFVNGVGLQFRMRRVGVGGAHRARDGGREIVVVQLRTRGLIFGPP